MRRTFVPSPERVEDDRSQAAWQIASSLGINSRYIDMRRAALAKEDPLMAAIGVALAERLRTGNASLTTNRYGHPVLTLKSKTAPDAVEG